MTEGNFVDYVKVHVTSGNGGKGSTHLRREKFVAMGSKWIRVPLGIIHRTGRDNRKCLTVTGTLDNIIMLCNKYVSW